VVSLVDIGPTLCDFPGGEAMPAATGVSLRPLTESRGTNWPNVAFSELPPVAGVPATRMIRSGRWKLIHYDGIRPQLFDIESDPQEFNDLGESPPHAGIRSRLQAQVLVGWSAREMEAELALRVHSNGKRRPARTSTRCLVSRKAVIDSHGQPVNNGRVIAG
jgi:arylsulfatase A-like enzyme